VKHGVAIRTDTTKISDGIDFVLTSNARQGLQVMNVNKTLTDLAV
jgi:hypothetical protein